MADEPKYPSLKGKRIIIYNDAKDFGGHEVMTLCVMRWLLAEGASLDCFYRPINQKWQAAIRDLAAENADFTLHEVDLPKIRFHQPYHFFHPSVTQEMAQRFRQLKADCAFVAQGTLETSAVGTLAARKAGLRCLSYIPLAHSFRELGSNRALRRDLFNHYLTKVPTVWLTNGQDQAARLRERGADQPIEILPNLVEIADTLPKDKARQQLGLAQDQLVIGMCGRIDNKQKGCDIFAEALRLAPKDSALRKSQLLFVGDGPDWPEMKQKLIADGWGNAIKHTGWKQEPQSDYPAFDLIVTPSRHEGLPISMQEAILCGVPIAASAVDGMATFLPSKWTCQPNSPTALLQLMESYLADPEAYRSPLPALKNKVLTEHSRKAFADALSRAFAVLQAV